MRSSMIHLVAPFLPLAVGSLLAACSGAAAGDGSPGPGDEWDASGLDGSAPDGATADAARAHDGAHDGATDAHGHDSAPPPPPPPNVDTLPWQTGPSVGFGVAMKDTENPLGDSVFIGYAGFQVTLDWAEAWVTELYKSSLAARGVRHIWAVQGPSDPEYNGYEIGNSKIVSALLPLVTPSTKFILAVSHSSGSFVAHELLDQLAGGADPANVTAGRVVFFDMEGGQRGLTDAVVARLHRAYFVSARDDATGTDAPHVGTMAALGAQYASAGGYWQYDASGSGCAAGAIWCVHVSLINTRPHDPTNANAQLDYSDFAGHPVCAAYIDAKGTEAGLVP